MDLDIFDDRGGVQAPKSYATEYWTGADWHAVVDPVCVPLKPMGGMLNSMTFSPVMTAKIRVVFTHNGKARSGVMELEAWEQ